MTKEVELRNRENLVLFRAHVPEGDCLSVMFPVSPRGKMRWYARPLGSHKWQPVSGWFTDGRHTTVAV